MGVLIVVSAVSRSVAVDPHRLDQDQRAVLLHHDSVPFRPVVMVAAGRCERLTQQKS